MASNKDEEVDGVDEENLSGSEEELEELEENWDDTEQHSSNDLLDYCKMLKEQGNRLFKDEKHKEAIAMYGEAGAYLDFIRSDSLDQRREEFINIKSSVFLNLAACYLKLEDHHEAQQAAEQAVEFLDANYTDELKPLLVKGLFRKAQAQRELEDYEEAQQSAQRALSLAPNSKPIEDELKLINSAIADSQKEGKKRPFSLSQIFSGLFGKGGKEEEKKSKKPKENSNSNANNEMEVKELLNSGVFGGKVEYPNTARALLKREISLNGFNKNQFVNVAQHYIPNGKASKLKNIGRRIYCGEFSEDGKLFVSASQDWRVRIYDTSGGNFTPIRTVTATQGQWTLTDACLSRDNSMLIYSSIIPVVHLYKIDEAETKQDFLDFNTTSEDDNFGIWSVRFSSDCREVIAGTSNNSLYVYNIERKDVERYKGHKDEVNAVCFSDKDNTNVVLTGSDDSNIFVWDRRSMTSKKGKPDGVLSGHLEGLTYLEPKGDGRYILSNAKDQTMKLWDLRKMISFEQSKSAPKPSRQHMWDYRSHDYPGDPRTEKHPNDLSVQTFVSHKVLRTLIRCHFSPEGTSGQRYVYSGSADGNVTVYDLSGKVVQVLRVGGGPAAVVRDVSWHPYDSVLVASSWDGFLYKFARDE